MRILSNRGATKTKNTVLFRSHFVYATRNKVGYWLNSNLSRSLNNNRTSDRTTERNRTQNTDDDDDDDDDNNIDTERDDETKWMKNSLIRRRPGQAASKSGKKCALSDWLSVPLVCVCVFDECWCVVRLCFLCSFAYRMLDHRQYR